MQKQSGKVSIKFENVTKKTVDQSKVTSKKPVPEANPSVNQAAKPVTVTSSKLPSTKVTKPAVAISGKTASNKVKTTPLVSNKATQPSTNKNALATKNKPTGGKPSTKPQPFVHSFGAGIEDQMKEAQEKLKQMQVNYADLEK